MSTGGQKKSGLTEHMSLFPAGLKKKKKITEGGSTGNESAGTFMVHAERKGPQ